MSSLGLILRDCTHLGINHTAGLRALEARRLAFYAPILVRHWLWATLVGSGNKKRKQGVSHKLRAILWRRVVPVSYFRLEQWGKVKQGSCLS